MTNTIPHTHLTAPSNLRDDAVEYIIDLLKRLSRGLVQAIVMRIQEFGGNGIALTKPTPNGSEMMYLPPALHAEVIALLPEMTEWHFANVDRLDQLGTQSGGHDHAHVHGQVVGQPVMRPGKTVKPNSATSTPATAVNRDQPQSLKDAVQAMQMDPANWGLANLDQDQIEQMAAYEGAQDKVRRRVEEARARANEQARTAPQVEEVTQHFHNIAGVQPNPNGHPTGGAPVPFDPSLAQQQPLWNPAQAGLPRPPTRRGNHPSSKRLNLPFCPPTGVPVEWDINACYADLEANGLLNDLFSQPYINGILRQPQYEAQNWRLENPQMQNVRWETPSAGHLNSY
ncbi:hypothetical protein CspHIS471_0604500 [Cutaneotrichosporon sp. HIS471]|nr:hypothetical protein CspHIS471_0604500 [Cutaneotrichosporon sp. HIS471]